MPTQAHAFRTLRNALAALVLALATMLPQAHADAPNPNGRTYAVLVGIADYPSSPLPRTDVDAQRIGAALSAQLPAERLRTTLLLNADATRGAVAQALRQVARDATEQDEVVFFFSGHGDTRADQAGGDEGDDLDETIVLYDGPMTDDELAGLLRPIKSRMALIAIDSCFSGGFLFDVGDENNRMTLLSSDEDLTSAVPSQEAGGWLSLYLAEALEGRADGSADGVSGQMQDGQLTALEIETYIEERFASQQRITASDPRSREVGYQRVDIKRTGVAPDDVFLNHGGEAATVARNVLAEQPGLTLPGQGTVATFPRVALSAEAGLTYVIETFDLGPNTDTVLELRQQRGAAPSESDPVVVQNDDADGLASRIRWTASSAGAYYAVVRPYAPQTGGPFGLRVVAITPRPDAPRPQVMAERTGLTLPATDAFDALPTEVMTLEAGRTYVVETFALAGPTDTVLQVRRMLGAAPAASDPVVAENDDADGLASRVRVTPRESGRYYAVVRPYAPQTAGSFGLRVIQMVPPSGAAQPTPASPTVTAPAPPTPGPAAGALMERRGIALPGTRDFAALPTIELPLEAGRTYVVETFDLAGATDTVLEVRRAVNGVPMASDPVLAQNDDAVGLASRVEVTADQAGTYYAVVAPYGGQTSGTFGLRVLAR